MKRLILLMIMLLSLSGCANIILGYYLELKNPKSEIFNKAPAAPSPAPDPEMISLEQFIELYNDNPKYIMDVHVVQMSYDSKNVSSIIALPDDATSAMRNYARVGHAYTMPLADDAILVCSTDELGSGIGVFRITINAYFYNYITFYDDNPKHEYIGDCEPI